jgi:5'-3' exoribonuclease 2
MEKYCIILVINKMGVPGFFAWLLKKYKNNNSIISSNLNTPINILYLDANCLIHPQCFKVLDLYPDWKDRQNLENKMMTRAINYIDYILNIIKPTDELYIAVDGVAPMAKMNQQRKRRYRSSDDKRIRDEIKQKYNKKICNDWSNTVITPGTEFMETLNKKLLKYINSKKDIKITYSSYHTPGEGEHKILQDIKTRKDLKDKTCIIYGLDADLIFLAMASDKPNLFLLREEQQFGSKSKNKDDLGGILNIPATPDEQLNSFDEEFNYVSIDNMKACINDQIVKLIYKFLDKTRKSVRMNIEQEDFTKDFIFVCYLLGNDFLPHLPSVHIKTGGLDFLLSCYTEIYVTQNGKHIVNIVNNKASINISCLKSMINKLSNCEDYYFQKHLPNHQDRLNSRECRSEEPYDKEVWNLENMRSFKIHDPVKLGYDSPELWKFRYYEHHFGINEHQDYLIDKSIEDYLRGVMWVTKYYFEACPSWEWQYSYTHAPFVSDISAYLNKNRYNINDIEFEKSVPLKPFTQLLSVLPPSCSNLLPDTYKKLVNSEESNILDLYPTTVNLDMINIDKFFECVPLIPCVDIKRVKSSIKGLKLNKDEAIRNEFLENYSN